MPSNTGLPISLSCDEQYQEREAQRVRKNVFKKSKHTRGFHSRAELAKWWIAQIKVQDGQCYYCKTPIRLLEMLVEAGLLRGRRTRGVGIRGPVFELERVNHDTNEYSPDNCALICYYCNNDKSHVYPREEYEKFLAPAKKVHFEFLAKKLASTSDEAA